MSQCPPGLDNNIGRGGGQKGPGSRKQLGSTLPKSQKITYLPRACREALYPQTLNRVPGDHLSIILHQKQKRANSAPPPHTHTHGHTQTHTIWEISHCHRRKFVPHLIKKRMTWPANPLMFILTLLLNKNIKY